MQIYLQHVLKTLRPPEAEVKEAAHKDAGLFFFFFFKITVILDLLFI